ncbi:leucine-rich repeat domain-containing protein [Schlesneria paludicola]|uniref:leucine-rich repeat domain-containing protein n=1 Tax=Schlesneria paludicola TaxID=360056 RepID=UPI00029A2A69|nr:leucine-rich repeat domain-containing protein [Schlesneria paludicola]
MAFFKLAGASPRYFNRLLSDRVTAGDLLMPCRMMFLVLTAALMVPCSAFAADVEFPDPNLDTVIREILKQKQIDKTDKSKKITDEDVASIFIMKATNRGIENLAGLEKCRNLAEVKLSGNKIKDLKPLEECVNIQSLYLEKNQISDITPLFKLTKLQYIELDDNQVQKLDGIQVLKALTSLYLSRNQVESVQPLAEMTKLHAIYLDKNKISDISPLKTLKWLERIDLKDNQIKDLSALSEMKELRFTFLERNQITELGTLVEMAKKDTAGERRFAPYWRLFLAGNPLNETGKAQLAELKTLGVRVE